MMSNRMSGLPRYELKMQAKELMRGNWRVLVPVTLVYLILNGVQIETMRPDAVDASGATVTVGSGFYASQYVYGMTDVPWYVVLGQSLLALALSVLISGVLAYCYSAWMVRLTEIGKSRPLAFGDFVEEFRHGLPAAGAYLWQQLWFFLWSFVLMLPGFIVTMTGVLFVGATLDFNSVIGLGLLLFVAALVAFIVIITRYSFQYQVLADGRGKVGPIMALRYSIILCKGRIWQIVLLFLSFIPWYLVGVFTLGVGMLFVVPYVTTTTALAYRWLRDEAFRDGRLDPAALGYVERQQQTASAAAASEAAAGAEAAEEMPVQNEIAEETTQAAPAETAEAAPQAMSAEPCIANETPASGEAAAQEAQPTAPVKGQGDGASASAVNKEENNERL